MTQLPLCMHALAYLHAHLTPILIAATLGASGLLLAYKLLNPPQPLDSVGRKGRGGPWVEDLRPEVR